MANLYQIDERLETIIEAGYDPETGEILEDFDLMKTIDDLSMELSEKIENIILYIKNLESDSDAIKKEEDSLAKRRKQKDNKVKGLTRYLDNFMRRTQPDYFDEEKNKDNKIKFHEFETTRVKLTYRPSQTVEVENLDSVPEKYIKPRKIKETDVDKTTMKRYLKAHPDETISGVKLVNKKNIQIK